MALFSPPYFQFGTAGISFYVWILQKRSGAGEFLLKEHIWPYSPFFLVGVGLTTAYRIKMINLAIYLKKSSLPSSLGAGGFR